MAKRRRRRNMAGDVQDYIEELAMNGWGAAKIFKPLQRKLEKEGRGDELPDKRTIQRVVKDKVYPDTSGNWSIADSAAEDARLVLDVLAYSIEFSQAIVVYTKYFSKEQAEWIIRLKKAAPDAPPRLIILLMHLYMSRKVEGINDKTDLDGYLALTPWKDRDCLRRYKRVVATGSLSKVPMWSILIEELFKTGLVDPRFTGTANAVREFEKDVYERSNRGGSPDIIVDLYDIHPDDVKDIIQQYEKGGTK